MYSANVVITLRISSIFWWIHEGGSENYFSFATSWAFLLPIPAVSLYERHSNSSLLRSQGEEKKLCHMAVRASRINKFCFRFDVKLHKNHKSYLKDYFPPQLSSSKVFNGIEWNNRQIFYIEANASEMERKSFPRKSSRVEWRGSNTKKKF